MFSQLYCRVSGTYLVVTLDRRVGLPLGLGTVLYTSADYLLREVPIAQQIDYVFMGPPSVNQSFNANPQAGNIVFVWHEPIADVVIAQAQAGAQGYTIEDPVLGIFRYSLSTCFFFAHALGHKGNTFHDLGGNNAQNNH